jgi:hypothetical protein
MAASTMPVFRKIVLAVLLVSGLGLIVSAKQVALAQWGLR